MWMIQEHSWKGAPSRWPRSKTWRSPSSPQIHQKYIYMWNNSYRTRTEHWQKTSDLPKGKKLPPYLGRAKEKRKNRDKRIGMGPAPVKEEMFPHTRKSFRRRRLRVAEGVVLEPRTRAQQRVQRAKRRDSRTEDWCQPALTSLIGLSAHLPGQVGAGS